MKNTDPSLEINAAAALPSAHDAVLTKRVRTAGWSILTLAGLVDSIYSRHAMQSDGISYLDMGDALLRRDWGMGINAYWSPLYPWLQGLALRLLKPSAYSQFTVVHFVNFLIYLFALGCFEYMLRAAVAVRSGEEDVALKSRALPKWSVLAVGYAVYLWSTLSMITMERVSPDLLMAGFLYLAVGLLLQIREQPDNFWRFVLLGAVLGLGYLAKVPMFPLSLVFLSFAWILVSDWRKAVPRILISVIVFLAVSGPWIAAISRAKGRFTFGDSGKVNYVLLVNRATPNWYFQNLGTADGHFAHPVRKIFDTPPIYEFATPVRGTIPVWYDPSYWADGAAPRVLLKRQLAVIYQWTLFYFDLLFTSQAGLLVGFAVLCFMSGHGFFGEQMAKGWPVWLMGLAGLGMYAMVYADPRYIAAFFALFWVGLFSDLKMPVAPYGLRLVAIVTVAVVVAITTPVTLSVAGHLIQTARGQPHTQWQMAEDLRKLGVTPGDRVARIGGRYGTDWARLLGLTIVAEVPRKNAMDFWCGKPEVQEQVIAAFRLLGVTTIVAEETPPDVVFVPGQEWHKLGDGTYYALALTADHAK
jgi:4-amino-4-deoxy-L-arabinose transferase-like glycosyltransferase